MSDQAHDLRRLAMEHGRPEAARAAGRPELLAVTGGKGGVGTTTVAIGLAVARAQSGKRTLLIDADPRGGDVALRCGAEERYTLADLLAGRQTWANVIATAPIGIQLVAGARWSEDLRERSSAAAQRLVDLLDDANLHADLVVLDLGNNLGRAEQRLCGAADAIMMVTTGEAAALLGTFAAIKTLTCFVRHGAGADAADSLFSLHLTVNRARTVQDAKLVRRRLDWACRRLLGINLRGGNSVIQNRLVWSWEGQETDSCLSRSPFFLFTRDSVGDPRPSSPELCAQL